MPIARHPIAIAAIVAASLNLAAIAQEASSGATSVGRDTPEVQQTQDPAQPTTADPSASESTQVNASQPQPAATLQARQRAFLRASSLIGLPVQGTADARLGVVGDILIDPVTYEFRYVLLDTGAGVGTNGLPVIPWIMFQPTIGTSLKTGILTVPLTAQRLTQVPTVTLNDAQILSDAAWVASVDDFFATDLMERRVSRPDLELDSRVDPNGRIGANQSQTQNSTDANAAATGGATNARRNSAGRTPGSLTNRRNRGPANGAAGAADNIGRNRGPATRTPGSVDNRGRNRGPANTTPGAVDNTGRNRGPANTAPGATDNNG